MKNIFYDTECFNDLFLVSFLKDDIFVDFIFHKDFDDAQVESLRRFLLSEKKKGSVLIGYNILKYDNNMLNQFLYDIKKTLKDLKVLNDKIVVKHEDTYPDYIGQECLDLMYFFPSGSLKKKNVNGKEIVEKIFKGLKFIAAEMKMENIAECSIPFDQDSTTDEEVNIIKDYCHNDVLLTKKVYESEKVQGEIAVRVLISERYGLAIKKAMMCSVASLSERVLLRLIGEVVKNKKAITETVSIEDIISKKIEFKTNAFKDFFSEISGWKTEQVDGKRVLSNGYANLYLRVGKKRVNFGLGGIHSAKDKDAVEKDVIVITGENDTFVVDIDAKSYYPSLIRTFDIGPEGIEKEYADLFKKLITLRDNAKTTTESDLYKLVLNGATGRLNYPKSSFYSPMANTKMVINGQLIMLELVEALHVAGFIFAQINTDGLSIVMSDKKRELFESVKKQWVDKWGFILSEAKYTKIVQRDVNTYIAITDDGKFKRKGFFNPANINIYPVVQKTVEDYLLFKKPIEESIDNAPVMSFTRFAKRKKWAFSGESLNGFNDHGTNRFFIANVSNSIVSVLPPLKEGVIEREILVEKNVRCANDIREADEKNIDRGAYVSEVLNNLKDYDGYTPVPQYSENLSFGIGHQKHSIRKENKMRELLDEMGFSLYNDRLSACPMCGSTSNSCVLYNDQLYCHSCRKTKYYQSLLAGIRVIQKEPEKENEKKQTEIEQAKLPLCGDSELPECVWEGYVGDVARVLKQRNADTLFTALTAASARIHRQIATPHGGGVPILGSGYYALIKKTASGKSTSLTHVKECVRGKCDYDTDVSSGQAIFNMIADPKIEGVGRAEKIVGYTPKPAVLLYDEASSLFNAMKIPNSTLGSIIRTLFMCVGAFTINKTSNLKTEGKTRQKVMDPTLSIGLISTEREFFGVITENLKGNGFLNRFLFFPGAQKKYDVIVRHKEQPDMRELARLDPIRTSLGSYTDPDKSTGDVYPEEVNTFISPYIEEFYNLYKYSDNPDADVCGRLDVHLHRLTLMYGVMTGNDRPTINNAKAAIAIIKMCEKYTLDLFERGGDVINNTPTSNLRNDVESCILKYVKKHPGCMMSNLKEYAKQLKTSEGEFAIGFKNLTAGEESTLEIKTSKNEKNGKYVGFVYFRE